MGEASYYSLPIKKITSNGQLNTNSWSLNFKLNKDLSMLHVTHLVLYWFYTEFAFSKQIDIE